MAVRPIFRFLLFLSSYFPAFVIVAILYWERDWRVAAAALSLGGLGLAGFYIVWSFIQNRIAPSPITVARCRRNDTEAVTYVLSYLVPFVGGILEGTESAVAYLVFFVVIGLLYVNSNMVHINPMLNLFGFRLYEAELENKETYIFISRHRIVRGKTINVANVGDEIYLESKR